MQKNKHAILISSNDDIGLVRNKFSNKAENNFIASEFPIIQLNSSVRLEYLFKYLKSDIDLYKLVSEVSLNWNKDKNGLDNIGKKDIDIGLVLRWRLTILFSNYIRIYFTFLKLNSDYKFIYISNNAPIHIKKIITYFSKKIQFYESPNHYDYSITSSPDRGKIFLPRTKKYFSSLFKAIQRPFLKLLKNKILVINDWTFPNIKNKKFLNINKINFLRSFYINEVTKKNINDNLFNFNLNEEKIKKNIQNIILKYGFEEKVNEDLTHLISETIINEYNDSRDILNSIFNSTNELFDYYEPRMVIVPGWIMSFYQSIFIVANLRKIPTMMLPDGIYPYLEPYLYPNDYQGNSLIKYFALNGDYIINLFKTSLKLDDHQIINIKPTFLSKKDKKFKRGKRFILILFPTARVWNPYSNWDMRYKYVVDVIKILKMKINSSVRIKIKIKPGVISQKKEIEMLKKILVNEKCSEIEVLEGKLEKYLDSIDFCIGGLGTAMFELMNDNIPFYAYEPRNMGMTEELIQNSILPKKMISITHDELSSALDKKNFVKFNFDKFYEGNYIQKIDYNKFL